MKDLIKKKIQTYFNKLNFYIFLILILLNQCSKDIKRPIKISVYTFKNDSLISTIEDSIELNRINNLLVDKSDDFRKFTPKYKLTISYTDTIHYVLIRDSFVLENGKNYYTDEIIIK